jgi:hypothetical protein
MVQKSGDWIAGRERRETERMNEGRHARKPHAVGKVRTYNKKEMMSARHIDKDVNKERMRDKRTDKPKNEEAIKTGNSVSSKVGVWKRK